MKLPSAISRKIGGAIHRYNVGHMGAYYAPIKIMPHLPLTGHRRGLDHFCVLQCNSLSTRHIQRSNDPYLESKVGLIPGYY